MKLRRMPSRAEEKQSEAQGDMSLSRSSQRTRAGKVYDRSGRPTTEQVLAQWKNEENPRVTS